MKIMGFNFSKVSVEKKSDNFKDLKINTNIDILDVQPAKNDILKQKEEMIVIKFKYDVDFQKDVGKVDIEGNLIIVLDPKDSKEVIKEWKDKKLSENIKTPVFNIILRKSTIKALELEDQMNLPLHTYSIPIIKKQE